MDQMCFKVKDKYKMQQIPYKCLVSTGYREHQQEVG